MRLEQIGESLEKIDGIFVTHEHVDHVKGIPALAKVLKKPVFMTKGTAEAQCFNRIDSDLIRFQAGESVTIGDIDLSTISVSHDANDPVIYRIGSHGIRAAIVTDLGYLSEEIKMQLRMIDILVLEANHDLDLLRSSPYPWKVKERIMGRKGHLSNEAAKQFIAQYMDSSVSTLLLAHLSNKTNNPYLVEQMLRHTLDLRRCNLTMHVVHPGTQAPAFTY
jgi:phosphoribosyl 1,2-cyclic phosphodiesterase